jgi:hypothetical protein
MCERYRLVVGEKGNEQGHIIETKAKSYDGAKRAMRREMAAHGEGQAWGRIEVNYGTGDLWGRIDEVYSN